MSEAYPKPGDTGGNIIRSMKASLKDAGLETPLTSHILIAFSGGADSTALAVALLKYGRRVVDRKKIRLLHVIHDWDPDKSERDLFFIRNFSKRWDVEVLERRAKKPPKGESWENWGRKQRGKIFSGLAGENSWVFTAHTGDDLAETHLWRFLSGVWKPGEVGIRTRYGRQVRPLLKVRKSDLIWFLNEEKQEWLDDPFNEDERFQRVYLRKKVLPAIEERFPNAVKNLMSYSAQSAEINREIEQLKHQFKNVGLRVSKGTWNEIEGSLGSKQMAVDLPGGYRLIRKNPKRTK